ARERAADPSARAWVLRGRACLIRSSSLQNRQEAQRAFERALVIDPQFIDAKVFLAATLVITLLDGWSRSPQQDQERAEQFLLEALEQDSNLATAHFAMGMLRRIQGKLTEAQIELERALALGKIRRDRARTNRSQEGERSKLCVTRYPLRIKKTLTAQTATERAWSAQKS